MLVCTMQSFIECFSWGVFVGFILFPIVAIIYLKIFGWNAFR